ncbi:MAG: hypothetical protein KDA37_07630, partial [Planctomycetales bacterium]|nr:hypothetical protein [Planctomycetales bacterium]
YAAEGRLVYLKDLQYDTDGNPVLLYLTAADWRPGPNGDPRTWTIAHHKDGQWNIKEIFTSDHNYDHGSLYIEDDGAWRIIAPTYPGADPWTTGGDMVNWISYDQGDSWKPRFLLTHDSEYNHTYARRPVNAHDDFYAFWADGDTLEKSESRLYFTDRLGSGVWQLPWTMEADLQTSELAYTPLLLSAPRTIGDFNEDGVIDAADYTLWRDQQGQIGADLAADANGDHVVDSGDYSIWRSYYGHSYQVVGSPQPVQTPEPAGGMLLTLTAASAGVRRCVHRLGFSRTRAEVVFTHS